MDSRATHSHHCEACEVETRTREKVWSHPLVQAGEPPGRTCHHCDYHNLTQLDVVSNPLALLHPRVKKDGLGGGQVTFERTWEDVRRA